MTQYRKTSWRNLAYAMHYLFSPNGWADRNNWDDDWNIEPPLPNNSMENFWKNMYIKLCPGLSHVPFTLIMTPKTYEAANTNIEAMIKCPYKNRVLVWLWWKRYWHILSRMKTIKGVQFKKVFLGDNVEL